MSDKVEKELILIVDDGRDNREFLVDHVLSPEGYRTLQASDGLEGYQMALKYTPDLILLDFQMPKMNGRQVLEKLREHELEIPVILMTLHGSEEVAIEVYRLGVKDYVKKPYYPEDMLIAINRALAEIRLKREKEVLADRLLKANRELQRRLQDMNTLYTVGKSVTSLADMNELLPRVVDATIQMTGAEEAFLCLIEKQQLVRRAYRNTSMPSAKAAQEIVRDVTALQVLRTREPALINKEFSDGKVPTSIAYVPLLAHDNLFGVLVIANYSATAPHFSSHEGALLRTLSDYASIAIENSQNFAAVIRSKEKMRLQFEQFVSPSVVEQVIETQEEVKLGGKRQEVSILFADIRGYTSWSETVAPEVVVDMLNKYLNLASGVIMGWEGTLDKYFGDGLMAIFNAPVGQEDHVHRVADAALAVIRAAEAVNEQHGFQLYYSIGVTVGEAVVGYIGSERALNYTAIGDVVNIAKRLQEAAQPGQILISEEVVNRLGSRVQAKALGEITLKNRRSKIIAYELQELR
jgi:class 3 adenylate cyclase/DNA-binding response OmpR family regulator